MQHLMAAQGTYALVATLTTQTLVLRLSSHFGDLASCQRQFHLELSST